MNIIKNLRIKQKLLVSFSFILVLLAAVGISGFLGVKQVNQNLTKIHSIRLPAMSFLLEADRDLHQLLIAERTLLLSLEDQKLIQSLHAEYETNKQQTLERWQKYAALAESREERALIAGFEKDFRAWEQSSSQVIQGIRTGGTAKEAAITNSIGSTKQQFETTREYLNQITEIIASQAEDDRLEASKAYIASVRFLVITVGVSVLSSIGMALLLASAISTPVLGAVAGLKEIATGQGDLTKRLTVSSKDEVGELTHWFNAFLDNMQDLIRQIVAHAQTTSATAHSLNELASQLREDASSLEEKSNSVSAATEEMSTSITSVASSMEEYSTNINVVATASEEMSSSVLEIARNTSKAREMTSESVTQSEVTSEKMNQLGKAALEISQVTEVINAISKQTNLLALNATIEAASAGQAGKGFAVVANEIKELAKQTAQATTEIQQRIDEIQRSSDVTIQQISRIGEMIGDVDEIVTTIAAAVEEQSVTSQEITGNITQASDSVQHVNRAVLEGSESSRSIAEEVTVVDSLVGSVSARSENLRSEAVALSQASAELNKLVLRFKV